MIRTTKVEIETHDILLVILAVFMLLSMFGAFSLENKRLNIQQELEQSKIEAECKRGPAK
jgi:hypothetical protein